MLVYNELKPGTCIVVEGEPYVVLKYSFMRQQQRKPTVRVKVKNIINGRIVEKTFGHSDKIEEAEIEKREVRFLYGHRDEFWFCPPDSPKERFKLDAEAMGESVKFIKPNSLVSISYFNDRFVAVNVPIKVDLKVTETMPALKGDQGDTKDAKLETGATIIVPLFIKEGDIIRINTETEEYVERISG